MMAPIDLRPQLPPVYSQGGLNSCTAQAVAVCVHLHETPSRLFIWYNTREKDRRQLVNSGTTIRGAVHSLVKQGACLETLWPYKADMFDDKPTDECYTQALLMRAELYARVGKTMAQIEGALRARLPVVFGIPITESFSKTGRDGIVPGPSGKPLGGHAMAIVGIDASKRFIVRNSWGEAWGDKGHCYIQNSLIFEQAYDLWVVKDLDAHPTATIIAPTSDIVVREWRTPLDSFSRLTGKPTALPPFFEVELPYPIQGYRVVAKGGFPEERPSSWQILGSSDKTSWTVLDTQTAVGEQFKLLTSVKFIRYVVHRSTAPPGRGYGRRVSLTTFSILRRLP